MTSYKDKIGRKCELLRYFPGDERELWLPYPDKRTQWMVVPWRSRLAEMEGTEIHHICGSGNGAQRVDVDANLISVCRSIHRWLEVYKVAGFVLCCYHKMLCGDPGWDTLQAIKGKLLPSWLETDQVTEACAKFPWIEAMRKELLR